MKKTLELQSSDLQARGPSTQTSQTCTGEGAGEAVECPGHNSPEGWGTVPQQRRLGTAGCRFTGPAQEQDGSRADPEHGIMRHSA